MDGIQHEESKDPLNDHEIIAAATEDHDWEICLDGFGHIPVYN